jgi:ADP-heptose:LPS heptosyltransferase
MARLARSVDWVHRLKRRLQHVTSPPNGLLLISAGGLGDTVLFSLVAERFAALAEPDEPVTIVLRRDGAKTAFCLPRGMTIETVDFGRFGSELGYRWQTLELLSQKNFRMVISTDFLRHPHLDEAMIEATGAPQKAAMLARPWRKYDRALEANRRMYSTLFDSGSVRVDKVVRWTEFANRLSGETLAPPKVRLSPVSVAASPAVKAQEIIIQPFSAVAAKQVDAAIYHQLLDALPSGFSVRITGLESDLEKAPEIRPLLARENVTFDGSTFAEISPRLRDAALVISVDTALMHLAAALGAPTLCLASAAYVGEIVPYDERICPENVTFVYESMPCEGCLGDCIRPLAEGRYACIDALSADDVVSKALRLLQSPSNS